MTHRNDNTKNGKSSPNDSTQDKRNESVVDFNAARTQKLEEKRKNTERIFFKHLLNVYSVVGTNMRAIEFLDLSEEGLAFQVPFDAQNPWPQDTNEMPIRIYFSQDTYLEVFVKIQNSRPMIDETGRYVRFGCVVDTTTASYEAYTQFVSFMRAYSLHAHKDQGKASLFFI